MLSWLLFAFELAVLGAVVLGAVWIVVAARRARPLIKARQQAIAALCAQRGLLPGTKPGDFALLGAIDPRWLTNSFSAPDHKVAVADFVRPAGKSTQFFTVLAFTVPGLNVPYVAVTRRNLLSATVGGPPTIELESTEFEEQFTVKAKDRRSAVMLLDPGMMQLLLDCQQVSFDMLGDNVLAFINRAREAAHRPTEPVEFEMLFKFYDSFGTRMPQLLRSEYAAAQ